MYVCVEIHFKVWSPLGVCVLFNEATFLSAKNPMVSKQGSIRKNCWHCKLSSLSARERKKKNNQISLSFSYVYGSSHLTVLYYLHDFQHKVIENKEA